MHILFIWVQYNSLGDDLAVDHLGLISRHILSPFTQKIKYARYSLFTFIINIWG